MREGGTPQVRAAIMTTATALALTAGCGQRPAPEPAVASAARADPDFRAPPSVVAAERDGAGGVVLRGRAQPGSEVQLRAPNGGAAAVKAGADGGWSVRLPPAAAPRAFALSAVVKGRAVRAEGGVLVAPAPLVIATMLRGGAPDLPIAAPGAGFRWTGLDTDPGGGAAVSGFAAPGAALRLAIDGVTRGEGAAEASGRFGVLWLGGPVPPGDHTVSVSTPTGTRAVSVRFGPVNLGGAPVRMTLEREGWRIDWAPPGGGVQTLRLLAPTSMSGAAS